MKAADHNRFYGMLSYGIYAICFGLNTENNYQANWHSQGKLSCNHTIAYLFIIIQYVQLKSGPSTKP